MKYGDYPAMFRQLLGERHDWTDYDVRAGLWPERVEEHDAFIVTGSSAGVYDPDPWIGDLLEFLRGAVGRTRLVGVCFGHQAMAQAFGGAVIKSPKGWGIGLHRYDVADAARWMDPVPAFAIPASHQDQVVELPPGARVLAGSDFTPFGMIEYPGRDAISIQLHPEFDPGYAEALIENRRGSRYSPEQADAAGASLHRPNDRTRFGTWITRFLEDA